MLEQVRQTIQKFSMLAPGDRVLVGVSGGPDSVVLLHILKTISEEYGISVFVAHLNHCFRGRDSEEDAEFVRSFSDKLGLQSYVESREVARFIAENKLSTQAGAREVRYSFFKEAARHFDCNKLATGHNANDQAETVLNHFLRGSGSAGMGGIPPIRDNHIIRPLIEVTREQIELYCRNNRLTYRTDKSNLKTVYTRNRIRLELIPFLEKEYNTNLVETLVRTSEIFREEDQFIQGEMLKCWGKVVKHQDASTVEVILEEFLALLPAIQKRTFRHAWEALTGTAHNLSFVHLVNALDFVSDARTGSILNLPMGITLTKSYGHFSLSKDKCREPVKAYNHELRLPGETYIPETGKSLLAEIGEGPYGAGEALSATEIVIDLKLVSLPLFVRNRREGDWFRPVGFDGSKKLKKFFIDSKIPRDKREKLPIIVSAGGDIVWIAGVKADRRWLATPETKQFLRLKLL